MKAGLCRGAGCTSVSIPLLSRSVTMPQPFEFSWSWLSARMMDLLSRRPVLACGVGGGRPAACAGAMGSPVVAKGGTRAMAASGLSLSAAAAAPWFGIWRAGGGMPAAELLQYFRQGGRKISFEAKKSRKLAWPISGQARARAERESEGSLEAGSSHARATHLDLGCAHGCSPTLGRPPRWGIWAAPGGGSTRGEVDSVSGGHTRGTHRRRVDAVCAVRLGRRVHCQTRESRLCAMPHTPL